MVEEALRTGAADGAHRGPSLRGVYRTVCDDEGTKPNSYLAQKLPDDPRFTQGVEELDMSFNYVGHAGFRAILRLLRYLPKLHTVHFNAMSLDNTDVEALCQHFSDIKTVKAVHLRNNARISLPSSPHLLRLLRTNRRIVHLSVTGATMSSELIAKIEGSAKANASYVPPVQPQAQVLHSPPAVSPASKEAPPTKDDSRHSQSSETAAVKAPLAPSDAASPAGQQPSEAAVVVQPL